MLIISRLESLHRSLQVLWTELEMAAWQYDKFLTRKFIKPEAYCCSSGSLVVAGFPFLPDFQLPGKRKTFQKFFGNLEFLEIPEIRKITGAISRNLIDLIFSFVGNFIDILIRRFLKVGLSAFISHRWIKNFQYI